ncbi:unnamed protein product [Hymenolepis diminuta]|nr:unnamed protein product [Hymenolepis diminuta]
MPSEAEIETALKAKAVNGKITVKDVLAALPGLGVATDKVETHLNEKKDANNHVDLGETITFIASL